MKFMAKLSDLRLIEDKAKPTSSARVHIDKERTASLEMDIRGKLVDEAIIEVDRYLDDCFLKGLSEIQIIHGKGTGALRQGIHNYLRRHPRVKSFRLGAYGEGDAGVTIVTLK